MVDRILEAAARVLIAYGYDGASTNRIARAAGVSPGSLYQYFSDKDAITSAVVDRLAEEISVNVSAVFRTMAGRSAEDGTRAPHISSYEHGTVDARHTRQGAELIIASEVNYNETITDIVVRNP